MKRAKWNEWGKLPTVAEVAPALICAILSNVVILWSTPRVPGQLLTQTIAGLLLTALLPGYLLSQIVGSQVDGFSWLESIFLALGLGFSTLLLGTLGLQYLPGPLTRLAVLLLYDGLILSLILSNFLRKSDRVAFPSQMRPAISILLILLLLGAFLRFANLGYSEFQGDEARAVLMAAGVARGADGILFLHRKAPGEILLPASTYALQGIIDEPSARLPFALANLVGLMGSYILARRMYPKRRLVAITTIGLLAVDGYLVAFSRIVQYQSLVFLMMMLSAWCAYVWHEERRPLMLLLSALFLAVGTLAHYEAVMILPFIGWLFWDRARQEGWPLRRWLEQILIPGSLFALLIGSFYIPYVLHPNFSRTAEYITAQRIGSAILYNNLESFFALATFYNSTYYIMFLSLGAALLIIQRLHVGLRSAILSVTAQELFTVGLLVAVLAPQALLFGDLNFAFVPFLLTLLLLILSPSLETELKATLLWFSAIFLVAMFLMRKPKTHVYSMFPAWAVMTGLIVDEGVAAIRHRLGQGSWLTGLKWGLGATGLALLALFGYYVHIVFVRHTPDYLRGYPETRPALYPVVYGDTLPRESGFGLPHRAGWKAIGALYAQGELQGSYISNEEPLITSWYTRQAAWCWNAPDYYFITDVVHDLIEIPVERIRYENHLLGRVWADGRPTLEIYTPRPVERPQEYELSELERVFDASARSDVWLWAPRSPTPTYRIDARLGQARLMGFDAPAQAVPGGRLSLVLYWQALDTFDRNFKVFTHLEVEGEQLWGQSDSIPACGTLPTTEWQPGQIVIDGHSLAIDPDTPPGEYVLLAGLYDAATGERLPAVGGDVNLATNVVYLGSVEVVPAPSP